MARLARRQHLLSAVAAALLACTTYSEPPSGPEGSAASAAVGGTSDGNPSDGGSAGKASIGSGAATMQGGSTTSAGMTGQAGVIDEGLAGAAACVDGDCCPEDPNKTDAGDCGCGVADTDSDTDGILDCQDDCPNDTNKANPETCGCGLPEQDTPELAGCMSLISALTHRYNFEGDGMDGMVWDRVGTADGTIVGLAQQTQLDERGVLALVGNSAYVNFPNFLISELESVTIETWVSWNGGKAWQRIFDFGESDAQPNPEDVPKSGKTYLFLTPMAAGAGSRFGFSLNGAANEKAVSLPMALAPTVNHLVAVVDTTSDKMHYYLNGVSGGEEPFTAALSDINDVNVWLGRSQYSGDPAFTGTYHEFRIYDQALTAKQVATSFAAGPDPDFLAR